MFAIISGMESRHLDRIQIEWTDFLESTHEKSFRIKARF